MKRLVLPACLLLWLLPACAYMTVEVDVLKPECLDSPEALQYSIRHEADNIDTALALGVYDQTRAEMKKAVAAYLAALEGDGVVPAGSSGKMAESFNKKADEDFASAKDRFTAGLRLADQAQQAEQADIRVELFLRARSQFLAGKQILVDRIRTLMDDVDTITQSSGAKARLDADPDNWRQYVLLRQRFTAEERERVDSLLGEGSLLDDPLAAFVVHAPDDCWRGRFNETYGSGFLGNADIAIKMESIGNFTLKGVRLDASKITEASFKVLGSGISMLARAYGLPVGTAGQGQGEEAALPQTDLTNAQRRKQAAEEKLRLARDASLEMLAVILGQEGNLADPEKRKMALKLISNSHARFSPQMKLDS